MVRNYEQAVTDEQRRDFLKALGVGGTVAAGGITLDEVRRLTAGTGTAASTDGIAAVGESVRAEMAGALDLSLLASQQSSIAEATRQLPSVIGSGIPETAPRNDFAPIAAAGGPIYDHLTDVGFFERTTTHLPAFTPDFLEKSAQAFVGSEALAAPLHEIGLSGTEGVDLITTVVTNAEQISDYHWVATDEIPREQVELGEFIPSMTQAAAGGALLWLDDLDAHLWEHGRLLTADIHDSAVWHAHSIAAGFQLMTEGAKKVAAGTSESDLSNTELGALLSTGFGVQAIAPYLLARDAYWVSEENRGSRRIERVPGADGIEYRTIPTGGD